MKNLTDIGFISKASGFHGEVVLVTEHDDLPASLRFLFLMLEGKPVPFLVQAVSEKNGNVILKLEDVDEEAAAKKLSGLRVFTEVPVNPTADESWHGLVGYEVVDVHAGSLGPLLAVEEFPGQVLGRCSVNSKEVLFPLSEDFLVNIDDDGKVLHLDLPEGLLSIYLSGH